MNNVKIALIQWIWDIFDFEMTSNSFGFPRVLSNLLFTTSLTIFKTFSPQRWNQIHASFIAIGNTSQGASTEDWGFNGGGNMTLKYLFILGILCASQSSFYHFFHNQPLLQITLLQITRHCGLCKGSGCDSNCIPCIFHRWDDKQISWKSEALNSLK